ncbi:3-hydroxybutyryl-CoA dehydrogenase [Microbacterium ulmi]|uniref:3-hydroxyacyl-CoA dehydrogenase family protein n=2 Tax=Microbacterium ulmi TaxID=179095 RepID=A0A7Y2Q231_9MICO|nr:3-hydroxybutyryl-CoA dehydrogenase [Microbacterium ulmi]NNH05007.1 3-hydroxyacyl-CoA dehydrogenase family protein [Microbacterium ulmi]
MLAEIQDLRTAVVGLGTMGRGIARMLSAAGATVSAFDPAVRTAVDLRQDGISGPEVGASLEACVADADIVFEAVFEDLDVKERVLRAISATSPGAVIASNTSTFRPTTLASFVDRPERLLVAHFFNPADLIPLVEIVPHAATDGAIAADVVDLMRKLGKRPVLLQAETSGFVANRLQAAMLRESLALIEAGVIDAAGIDAVVMSALAPRWTVAGPIGVADQGGLDIFAAVCAEIFPTLDNAEVPPDVLLNLVAAGRLGEKGGSGFYEHTAESAQAARQRLVAMLAITEGWRRGDQTTRAPA